MDVFNAVELNALKDKKVVESLEKIRRAQNDDEDLSAAINTAAQAFNDYFIKYGASTFTANSLKVNQIPTSAQYNENLETLDFDVQKLYDDLDSLSNATISAYNYATITAREVKNRAQAVSSKVLDLNILSNFSKGSTIVAGDDFVDGSKIDSSFGVDTSRAQLLDGAGAVSLLTVDAEVVTSEDTQVTVIPIAPVSDGDKVNTDPTPGNLQRFYEGQYYAPVGEQRPEGGKLELKYIVDPAQIPDTAGVKTIFSEGGSVKFVGGGVAAANKSTEGGIGFYAVVPPNDEDKNRERSKMFDGNPSTFWEAEFVYESPQLIDPYDIDETESEEIEDGGQ